MKLSRLEMLTAEQRAREAEHIASIDLAACGYDWTPAQAREAAACLGETAETFAGKTALALRSRWYEGQPAGQFPPLPYVAGAILRHMREE